MRVVKARLVDKDGNYSDCFNYAMLVSDLSTFLYAFSSARACIHTE